MAYADPQSTHNPTTNTIAPAAWGDVIRDDLEWLARNKPMTLANASGTQSISNSTWTTINLAAETFDIGSCHSTVTNNSRLTVPSGADGKYRIVANAGFAANSTNSRHARIQANGSLVIAQDVRTASSFQMQFQVVAFVQLAAGTYIELQQLQDSGGSLNADGSSWLAWEWVGI